MMHCTSRPTSGRGSSTAYLPHEREARARGVPMLGSGRIFMTPEDAITEPALEYIPAHWAKLWGIDPGIGHPFGAVLMLWDRDNDVCTSTTSSAWRTRCR
jgi:hypothetical protein